MKSFGERLKHLRENVLDITQQKLADALGTKRQNVANWEVGKNEPSQQMVVQIADYFKVSTDWLLKGVDYPNKPADGGAFGQQEMDRLCKEQANEIIKLKAKLYDLGGKRKPMPANQRSHPSFLSKRVATSGIGSCQSMATS